MSTFTDILNKSMEDIKPPQPLPIGTYMAIVDGVPEIKQIGRQGNSAAVVKFKVLQPQPDVDSSALIEALDGKQLTDVSVASNFFLTDAAAYRLKDFLGILGISLTGKSLGQGLNEAPGKSVLLSIGHRPSDDGKAMYMDVKGYAAV